MPDILSISIGIGLLVSLSFSEFLGLTAGGMVVPGYIALYLNEPYFIGLTFLISYLTYFFVNSLSSIMIIYGRRRTTLMILVGFFAGAFLRSIGSLPTPIMTIDLTVIGYIIPGLIAIWIDRQGIVESLSSLIIAGVIVRITLILLTGGDLKI
jgi:gamma-polyglutamate biosynthesis protein CapC